VGYGKFQEIRDALDLSASPQAHRVAKKQRLNRLILSKLGTNKESDCVRVASTIN
jgi:hypothetical protein